MERFFSWDVGWPLQRSKKNRKIGGKDVSEREVFPAVHAPTQERRKLLRTRLHDLVHIIAPTVKLNPVGVMWLHFEVFG